MTDLQSPTQDNLEFMIEAIKTKLRMASGAAMQAGSFSLACYEDVKDIYDIVASKDKFSISEVEAIVSELGKLRKS
ncbi:MULTISPECIES: DUF1128 domain-containing protein [Paenibacillus]|jgi:uncharacterized protein YfkK (UPF0435 family)|uniref:DUF1128 domain-containing protein n=1 Tax=Paenibacillus agaridevorans TaxID=171404 RepID=A0A2R5ENB1_9BACL|nr:MULTISPECIES: DUF1128 domain-containing protein [Paenibacillus]QNK59123.1 DUF1128 domain-containing protein [Paenibacillus sp. PAMC21692]GBG08132.1 hypothetical protein PAT3040_02700 [Paenibacillus agaridevorans]